MPDIKELLISPFSLVPSSAPHSKKEHRSYHLCKCDSDEENDYGMAAECVFYCASLESDAYASRNKTTKKHKQHKQHKQGRHNMKKTRKHATS